jgi:hypothetical protein
MLINPLIVKIAKPPSHNNYDKSKLVLIGAYNHWSIPAQLENFNANSKQQNKGSILAKLQEIFKPYLESSNRPEPRKEPSRDITSGSGDTPKEAAERVVRQMATSNRDYHIPGNSDTIQSAQDGADYIEKSFPELEVKVEYKKNPKTGRHTYKTDID